MIKVAVLGSAGRMGRALIKGIAQSSSLSLSAAIDKPGLKSIGEDSGLVSGIEANGILISDSLPSPSEDLDVVIDFTSAQATARNIEVCLERKLPIVFKHLRRSRKTIRKISFVIPMFIQVQSWGERNNKLVELASQIFGESVDIEIVESHHNKKIGALLVLQLPEAHYRSPQRILTSLPRMDALDKQPQNSGK